MEWSRRERGQNGIDIAVGGRVGMVPIAWGVGVCQFWVDG